MDIWSFVYLFCIAGNIHALNISISNGIRNYIRNNFKIERKHTFLWDGWRRLYYAADVSLRSICTRHVITAINAKQLNSQGCQAGVLDKIQIKETKRVFSWWFVLIDHIEDGLTIALNAMPADGIWDWKMINHLIKSLNKRYKKYLNCSYFSYGL